MEFSSSWLTVTSQGLLSSSSPQPHAPSDHFPRGPGVFPLPVPSHSASRKPAPSSADLSVILEAQDCVLCMDVFS